MARIHFIGICGTAMATLAAMLKARGHHVQGSDAGVYPPMSEFLLREGIPAFDGYRPEHITTELDQVVVGNAISRGNPEAELLIPTTLARVRALLPGLHREQRERPVAHQVVIDEIGLPGRVGHAESRMYSRQLVPKNGSQGARFESRPHLNRGQHLVRSERVVNSRRCCLANVGVLRVCCDADDFLGDQSGSSVDA
jgi:hypothetical protein